MSRSVLDPFRWELLSGVQGDILEIGFGTGVNLAFYPEHVQKITTLDHNPGMHPIARQRIKTVNRIAVFHRVLDSQHLPIEDGTYDCVVSTFTLCSIQNVSQALKEIYRVLKPEGKFFFLEHGCSPHKRVRFFQNMLTPLTRCFGDGCHLNRDIKQLLTQNHFNPLWLKECYAPKTLKSVGYLYMGTACKSQIKRQKKSKHRK